MSEGKSEGKSKSRGFAGMSPERRREIARLGGRAVPNAKRSFSVDRELAREAGRVGGKAMPKEKRSFSVNRALAQAAGRAASAPRKAVQP